MRIRNFVLFLIAALFTSTQSYADSSVWKVSKGDRYLYIGGTVHLLKENDHPLPEEFDQAYADSDIVYFETDLASAQSPEFQGQLMQALSLTGGRTLQSTLKPETYTKLSEYFTSQGGQMALLQPFTPSGAAIMLTAIEFSKLGFVPELGVDVTYFRKANKDKKPVDKLESVDEQIAFLANMAAGKDDELILQTIRDISSMSTSMNDMKSAWRNGDLEKLQSIALAEFKADFPETYRAMIVQRNNKWLTKIKPMLADESHELILVGALHLVGSDGLLQQLQEAGYSVTKL